MPASKPTLFNREPALFLAFVQALLALLLGFGVELTAEQSSLILAAVAAFVGLVIRSQVSPTKDY